MTQREAAEVHADILSARKMYPEAIAAYQAILKVDPGSAVVLDKIGIAYLQLGDLKSAERYFKRANKADKNYGPALNNLGAIEYQKEKFRKAVRFYKKALELEPTNATYLSNLGYAYFGDKQYTEALNTFAQALRADPKVFERMSGMGTIVQQRMTTDPGYLDFLLAKTYAKQGDAERCAHYLTKARDAQYKDLAKVKDDPDFAGVLKDPRVQEALTPAPPPSGGL